MLVTAMGILINAKKKDLEEKLTSSEQIADFDIEDLDKNDRMKDVMVSLRNPTDLKFASEALEGLLGGIAVKTNEVE